MNHELAAATLAFLKSIEWQMSDDNDCYRCPSCGNVSSFQDIAYKWFENRHSNDCALKKLIGMYREILKDNGTE